MLTLFGKFVRKLRIDNEELLKEMADKLEVTSSYLSAVENGKRNVPQDWFNKIVKIYDLNDLQSYELKEAIQLSQSSVKLNLKGYNNDDRNLMLALARELKDLDDDDKKQLHNILIRNKKGGK